MELVNGTYQGGHVDLGQAVDWPEGTAVEVKRRIAAHGMREEDWPQGPEQIEKLLAEWEAIQPLVFTAEEMADFETNRKQMGFQSMEKLDSLASDK